jgi:hypothetical protein
LSHTEVRNFALLDDDGNEIPLYNSLAVRVPRRYIVQNVAKPPCGVLVNLENIQGLFNTNTSSTIDVDIEYLDDQDDRRPSPSRVDDDPSVHVEAYPLAFLKTAGNIKATGVPYCFSPLITKINKSVRKNHQNPHNHATPAAAADHDQSDHMPLDSDPDASYSESTYQAIKPVSSQFYNYLTHRVASRAGRHDAQQGSVTAAISGAYATTDKDKKAAKTKQQYCKNALPSDRFHARIASVPECPTACRAELVYSIDVRALKQPTGSCVIPFSSFNSTRSDK